MEQSDLISEYEKEIAAYQNAITKLQDKKNLLLGLVKKV